MLLAAAAMPILNTGAIGANAPVAGRSPAFTPAASAFRDRVPGGGGYDFYSRLVVRYLGRHLPGNPTFILQNMPGAAGVAAADYLYNEARRDGSEIGMVGRAVGTLPLLDPRNPGPKYEATKFNWIGTPQQEVGLNSGALDFADRRDWRIFGPMNFRQRHLSGFSAVVLPAPSRRSFRRQVPVIDGYKSSQDALLALSRGEVDGRVSGSSAAPLRAQIAPAVRSGVLRIIAQIGLTKDPDYPNVPLVFDRRRRRRIAKLSS